MGLFFNSTTNKGGGFDRFKRIGGMEGNKILNKMRPEVKAKLKPFLANLGTSKKSVESIAKAIGRERGYETKKKFLEAAERHFSPADLTREQVKRNLKSMIQKDVSAVEEMGKTGAQRAKFSTLGEVGSTSQFLSRTGPGATKGSAADLNTVNKAKTGFAGQTSKSNNTSGHNTPPSSVRSKPLGIGPGSRL